MPNDGLGMALAKTEIHQNHVYVMMFKLTKMEATSKHPQVADPNWSWFSSSPLILICAVPKIPICYCSLKSGGS